MIYLGWSRQHTQDTKCIESDFWIKSHFLCTLCLVYVSATAQVNIDRRWDSASTVQRSTFMEKDIFSPFFSSQTVLNTALLETQHSAPVESDIYHDGALFFYFVWENMLLVLTLVYLLHGFQTHATPVSLRTRPEILLFQVYQVAYTPLINEQDRIYFGYYLRCSWLSVHPNIPAPDESWWRGLSRSSRNHILGFSRSGNGNCLGISIVVRRSSLTRKTLQV